MTARLVRTTQSYPCALECGSLTPLCVERSSGSPQPSALAVSPLSAVASTKEYPLRKLDHRRIPRAKSFRIRSYEKCVCKFFRIRSYKNIGLKTPCFHTLTKNIGGRGSVAQASACVQSRGTDHQSPITRHQSPVTSHLYFSQRRRISIPLVFQSIASGAVNSERRQSC